MNRSQQTAKPSFAGAFPDDDRLSGLVDAFARGDYARVREAGARLAREADDERVRRAARELVERTGPDRLTRVLFGLAALLLLVLSGWWILHGRAPRSSPPGSGSRDVSPRSP